jgi:hypothetical protein
MYLMTNDVDGVEKTFINPAAYPVTRGQTVDRLYENIGDSAGHPVYRNVSKQAGVTEEGYGLGLAVDDLNGDGWPDVYVANDFMPNDQLLINQRNKTFKESARESMRHQTYNGMGVDIADINNDGKPDIMVLDMLPQDNGRRKTMIAKTDYQSFSLRKKAGYVDEYMRNTLQLNQGTDNKGITYFSDIAQLAGVNATDWSWSVLLADFDNDGFRDAYITNGFPKNITDLDFLAYNADNNMFGGVENKIRKTKELLSKLKGINVSNYIFRNTGNLCFEDRTAAWGLKAISYSNGAAYADLDNDGDLDLVTNNIDKEAFVYQNHENDRKDKNNYLELSLKGSKKNINAIGARVILYCGKDSFYSYNSPVRGYLSSMATPLTIGLGRRATIDSLSIRWPDGKGQIMRNIRVNQHLTISWQTSSDAPLPQNTSAPAIFENVGDRYSIHYQHNGNDNNPPIDELMLPRLYSRKGPGISVGDIDNKDGPDFFIGGTSGHAGSLFVQDPDGRFTEKKINPEDAGYEDMGSLLFDADNDGHVDLYVVSGGNNRRDSPGVYQDRLYLNDGKGNFTRSVQSLPVTASSGSCVVGADFDKDGDIDLFRGGGTSPGSYPTAPRSYLLKNEGSKFVDVTADLAPALLNIGMVTSAIWTDFDNDGWIDLVVVGEWMSPVFLKNEKGRLVDISRQTGLANTRGWWNSIYAADIDNDGNIDLIVGNMGTNIDYRPAKDQPLELFYSKFNGSARAEPVLSCYMLNAAGKKERFPLHFRDDLVRVIPSLKKKYWNYETYGKAGLDNLFKTGELSGAAHWQADLFESCILKNNGKGKFSILYLPQQAQLSCINGILPVDFDHDGKVDLIVTGNSHADEVVYGWMDASLGLLLKGDGKGSFIPQPAPVSGLFLSGDMRSLACLYGRDGQQMILAASNSDSLTVLGPVKRASARIFFANPLDVYAIIEYQDGHKTKQEFYYGGGYLSQSARAFEITGSMKKVEVTDSKGYKREISL